MTDFEEPPFDPTGHNPLNASDTAPAALLPWQPPTSCVLIDTTTMDWKDFSALSPHPVQRQTLIHGAALLASGALSSPHERHRHVSVMLFDPSGRLNAEALADLYAANPAETLELYGRKANGHSRDLLWAQGSVVHPDTLRVDVYAVDDMPSAVELYSTFDSKLSTKTQSDVMTSTLRLCGIDAASSVFRTPGALKVGLDFAWGVEHGTLAARVRSHGININRPEGDGEEQEEQDTGAVFDAALLSALPYLGVARLYTPEIAWLDAQKINGKLLPVMPPFLGAYLAILKADPENGRAFMTSLLGMAGSVTDGRMDPVYVVKNIRAYVKRNLRSTAAQRSAQTLSAVLAAFKAWKAGTTFVQYPVDTRVVATFNPVRKLRLRKA